MPRQARWFDSLSEAVCVVQPGSLAVLDRNARAVELLGAAKDAGSVLTDHIQPWNPELFSEALATRQFNSPELRGVTGINPSGGLLQLDLSVSVSKRSRSEVYLIVLADAGPRIRLEEQLRQAQKMESVGMLAGGIAHDFNNLLTIISGYSHMLASSLASDEKNRFAAEQVIKASERAAGLTRQLLSFSRRQITQNRVLDLSAVAQGMVPMLNRIIGEHIDLQIVAAPDLGRVRADPGQVEQIIMNLVVNARDAMPEGGKLWIEIKNIELDSNYLNRHMEARPGPYVMLAVSDTGVGMDPAVRDKIFEPFFTTKPDGQGTGLGLSMVYGIAKRFGGTIDVYSEPGCGTAVKVYLPSAESGELAAKPDPLLSPARGSETVLLVEDEEAVRNIVRAALEAQGYHLLVAASGEIALTLFKQNADAIQLVITDVVLPNMNGREVARRIHKKKPEIVVLFMSGYTDVALNEHASPDDHVHFIGKPFTPAALARKVRELLDARHSKAGTKRHCVS